MKRSLSIVKIKTNNYPQSQQDKGIKSINERPLVKNTSSPFIQPQMRFTPRTHLERVIDSVVSNTTQHNINPNTLKRHLLRIINTKVNESAVSPQNGRKDLFENLFKAYMKYNTNNASTAINTNNTVSYANNNEDMLNQKYYNKVKQQLTLNTEAKEVLSDLHNKTHFKAAIELAGNTLIPRNNMKYKLTKRCKNIYVNTEIDNDDEYTKHYNPYIQNNSNTKDKLSADNERILKQLIQKKTIDNDSDVYYHNTETINNHNNNNIRTTSKDYVKIDNVEYNKNFQMDTIAQLVLHKCNITHSKSKYNPNSLRNKTGKLMITKGMSVKDFKHKYNV